MNSVRTAPDGKHLKAVQSVVCFMSEQSRLKSITLVQGDGGSINDAVIEAVQSVVRLCPAVKALRYINGHTGLDSAEEFLLAPCIHCCLVSSEDGTKDATKSSIRLSTKTKTVQDVQDFIDECYKKYTLDLQNKLEGKLYVFDQMIPSINTMRELNLPALPKLQFNKQRFVTGKSFENIFFAQKQLVQTRVRFFLERPDWYQAKGVAHTLGILLTGPPGTGKTSLIKAIARETNRHILNVQMAGIETKQQFADLFYENTVQCKPKDLGERHETLNIPVENRIIVLEDLDCAGGNITLRRTEQPQKPPAGLTRSQPPPPAQLFTSGGSSSLMDAYGGQAPKDWELKEEELRAKRTTITLADILNVLDGAVETPSRIIIFTTNHPEKIDTAMLRPGRVDLQIHFELASQQSISDMYECYYDTPFREADKAELPDKMHSPALISSVLLGCFGDPEGARQKLLSMAK